MSDKLALTYRKKILLYLNNYTCYDEDELLTVEVTQEGIARGVDMSRTHVSRILQGLNKGGYLEERSAHVKDRSRKLKTYTLTDKGIAATKDIISGIEDVEFEVIEDGKRYTARLNDIIEEKDMSLLEAVDQIESKGILDLDSIGPEEPVIMLDEAPDVSRLFGRGELLSNIDDWMNDEPPIAVLYGTKGFGASGTARRFLDSVDDRHILWLSINGKTDEDILSKLCEFAGSIGCDAEKRLFECLRSKKALIVIDNYYDVRDEIVDTITDFVNTVNPGDNLKVIITVREGTPVYERFYHKEHVEKGIVKEFKVPPLKSEDAKKLLNTDLDPEALKRIMQMTKGSPLLLNLLKEGDIDGMKDASPLTKGQISLLMFLKTQENS